MSTRILALALLVALVTISVQTWRLSNSSEPDRPRRPDLLVVYYGGTGQSALLAGVVGKVEVTVKYATPGDDGRLLNIERMMYFEEPP